MGITKSLSDMTAGFLKRGSRLLGERRSLAFLAHLAERLPQLVTIRTHNGEIKFHCPGDIPLWRAETLLTKEPETIEWIDSFDEGCVFWDIGANVGVYSMYAALKINANVLAFEPAAFNYHIINKNIELNKMENRILSLCLAFSDSVSFGRFYMSETNAGSACSNFAEARDWQGMPFTPKFKQGMIAMSIDGFIEKFCPPFPNHIKIDVDGIEDKIVKGAKMTIADKRLKSIMVELDTRRKEYADVMAFLESCGMKLLHKKHAAMFDTGEYASTYNHIFIRTER